MQASRSRFDIWLVFGKYQAPQRGTFASIDQIWLLCRATICEKHIEDEVQLFRQSFIFCVERDIVYVHLEICTALEQFGITTI